MEAPPQRKKRVLFVCSHNSNRSIAAEAVARKLRPDLEVQSAGTMAAGTLNPVMIKALEERGFSTAGMYSKVNLCAFQLCYQTLDKAVVLHN
jgi:arsenate reductase